MQIVYLIALMQTITCTVVIPVAPAALRSKRISSPPCTKSHVMKTNKQALIEYSRDERLTFQSRELRALKENKMLSSFHGLLSSADPYTT